jgi:rRNA maturation RNase YbeY
MAINFHSENIDFELTDKRASLEWIKKVVQQQDYTVGTINYIFCSDEYLLDLNKRFLDHDTYTDVITFDYKKGKVISGDIFISIDRIRENAGLFGKTFDDELNRVMVHGILHLCGYKDKTDNEASEMRKMEDHYLSIQ